tara:strand:- start:4484 stop:5128 length:645 start_codon:yes stop_codon:yes gene_type:complete
MKVLNSETFDETVIANDFASCISELKDHLNKLVTSVNSTTSSVFNLMKMLDEKQSLLEESSDIVWWLVASRSRVVDQAYAEIDPKEASLYSAKDVANLTRVPPGPASIHSMLKVTIDVASNGTSTAAGLQTVVNKVPKTIKKLLCAELGVISQPTLFPIHTALQKSLEANAWKDAFESATGLSATQKMQLPDLGLLFYRECLLQKQLDAAASQR